MAKSEAQTRSELIDQQLALSGWNVKDPTQVVEKVEGIKSRYQQSLADLEDLYGTLSQQAFKGELDLSRVVLPNCLAGESLCHD